MAKDVIEVFQGADVSFRVLSMVASSSVKRETNSGVPESKIGAGKGSLGAKQDDSTVAAKSRKGDTRDNLRVNITKN